MKDKEYNPINCNLYDELEIIAMRKQRVNLTYMDNGTEIKLQDAMIKNLYSREKVEYLILKNGNEIRLDHLVLVDGKIYKRNKTD